jgi:hypothetical protein
LQWLNELFPRVVLVLDCCYAASAKICKGHGDNAARLVDIRFNITSGECLLSASQAFQEANVLVQGPLAVYYLPRGLRGKDQEVFDRHGNTAHFRDIESRSNSMSDAL